MPCNRRPQNSTANPCDRAITGMLNANAHPLRIISGLRPIQSASNPANNVESTLPSSTAATITESAEAVSPEVAAR